MLARAQMSVSWVQSTEPNFTPGNSNGRIKALQVNK